MKLTRATGIGLDSGNNVAMASGTISPDGSTLTPGQSGSLVTSAGTWTFGTVDSTGQTPILLNGSASNGGHATELEVDNGGNLFAENATGWYEWTGSGWSVASNPSGSASNSPDGSTLTPGQSGSLVTSAGTWTFGTVDSTGQTPILLNGSASNGGHATELEVDNGGNLFAENATGWYEWTGSGWSVASNPSGSASNSPDGSTLTPGQSGSLVTSAGTWTFGTVDSTGQTPILLNGSASNGGHATELEVDNGGNLFAENATGWYEWTGSGWSVASNPSGSASNSPDGSTLTPGQSGSLVTSAGTWTFGTVDSTGQTPILLNGSASNGGHATELEVDNGGNLFAENASGWYEWNGSGWSVASNPNPAPSPPTTTAAFLNVAENATATPIGIAAPTDPHYSAAQLTVTVTGLPSDGTVYLANGTTAVTSGETLTVAQLTGLTFRPTTGAFSQSSSFAYTVTDPTGLSAAGTASLSIGPETGPVTTAASLTVAENAAATAIGIAAPTDPNYNATQLTVAVTGLPSDGTIYLANGTTAVTSGETLTVAQLSGLTFKPTAGVFSQSSIFNYTVSDPAGLHTSGAATLAIGAATSGIVFNNTFTANVTSAYKNDILAAEAQISSLFSNPIALNLTFDAQAAGTNAFAAENSWPAFVNVSYAQLKSALTSHDFSTYAASAIASLPSSDPNPAGGKDWALPEAYAKMLGLSSSTYSTDDTITLNTSYNWSYGQDVINTIEHEISEGAMGRVGGLGDQNGVWSAMDLFRYSAAGARDYTDGRDGATTYFSYNGGTTLSGLSFNNEYSGSTKVNGYDTADFTQLDPFGTVGLGETISLSQTDIEVLDVLGWDPSATGVAGSATIATGTTTAGSAGSTAVSLPQLGFAASTTLGYSANSDGFGGAVPSAGGADLSQTALLRSYMASTFATSSDGNSGTPISEAAQGGYTPAPLTLPHATG